MSARGALLAMAAIVAIVLGGCYRATYLSKVSEAENLGKELSRLRQENAGLLAENTEQRVSIASLINVGANTAKERDRLAEKLASATADRERMEAECRAECDALRARLDAQSRALDETGRRVRDLAVENDRLRQDIAALQKVQQEKIVSVTRTYESWIEKMKAEISKGQVTITESKGSVTVNVVDSILFESGRAELHSEGMSLLTKTIPLLRNVRDRTLRVEGHTDSVPIASNRVRYSNWELSAARAVNVARYLQEQGVDPRILSVVAYGEHRPIADNRTPEGRAKNRRIELILTPRS